MNPNILSVETTNQFRWKKRTVEETIDGNVVKKEILVLQNLSIYMGYYHQWQDVPVVEEGIPDQYDVREMLGDLKELMEKFQDEQEKARKPKTELQGTDKQTPE